MQDPLFNLLLLAGALYVAWMWRGDWRAWRAGSPRPNAFPGATDAPTRLVVIAVMGALVLVALETAGEYKLGIADEQTTMSLPFALYAVLGAPVLEELIFRGYLVYTKAGKAAMWGAAVGLSLVFALLHPHLWAWTENGVEFHFTTKAAFSTGALFVGSLWFYWARLTALNVNGSLLPSVAAHVAKNLGVVIVKIAAGHFVLWPSS